LSALESGATALQTAALRHHLDRWGELSVVHGPILSEVRDELAGDAREEGDYLVTLDDELLAGATAWRSRSELELQAVRWFDRLGLEARKQVRVKELLEVEVRLLRLQEPSRYSLASVARGSTALLRMPRGLASSLQREGLGLCGTQLGLPVSVTRPEDWLPAQRPAPDGVRGERGAGGRVAES
jgi:hypothetical protein